MCFQLQIHLENSSNCNIHQIQVNLTSYLFCIIIYTSLALLVRIQVTEKSKTSGRKLTELRESAHQLFKESELSEANGDEAKAEELHQAAQLKEIEVMKLLK